MLDVTNMLQNFLKRYGESRPKGEQSSMHKHLLYNQNGTKNYNDKRFKILSRARNLYHFLVLQLLFIKTLESKVCKQREVNN